MTDTQSAINSLDDRYGKRTQRGFDKKIAWISGSILVVGTLFFFLFGGAVAATPLEFKDVSYEVVDGRTVDVRYQVSAAPGDAVACAFEALSESFATVGWKVIELPVSETRTRMLNETIVTSYPATTGTVRGCWVLKETA